MTYKDIVSARKDVDRNPTEKQKEAGNYKKGHVSIHGLSITIENPKGSYRRGKSDDGHEWKTLMHNDYGYFTRTVGKDGDAIDVFIGPNLKSEKVFPIDQYFRGEFDETKIMLGFNTKEEAKAAYLSNYNKDWKGFKYITEVDLPTFKKWLYDGYRQRKPFAKYVRLTESTKHMINEDFSSKLLAKLAKEHGGIKISNNGGVRTFPCAFIYGHSVNPSEITDDMIVGEPFEYTYYTNDSDNAILFNDGMAIALRKDSDLRRHSDDRKIARFRSGIGDTGDHNKTPDAFNGNEKKSVSAPYNGWQSSERAGYSQSLRNAYKVNKEMGDEKVVNNIKAKARKLVAESALPGNQLGGALAAKGVNVSAEDIIGHIAYYASENNNFDPREDDEKARFEVDEEYKDIYINAEGVVSIDYRVYKGDYWIPDDVRQDVDGCYHAELTLYTLDDEKIGTFDITKELDNYFNKSARKNIYMTESQFKNYCRFLLREKRKGDYIKKLLNS